MKVLFATKNPAKVRNYVEKLKEYNIELITINDIDTRVDVVENGKDAIENARIKAESYYNALKIPTIGMDNNLYFDDVPESEQPGVFVRRVGGKELSDEEMIEHYTDFVKRHGGKVNARWKYGMVLIDSMGNEYEYKWHKGNLVFLDHACSKRNPGYPLDSIAMVPEYNKYLVELTNEEREENNKKNSNDHVIEFIVKNIK